MLTKAIGLQLFSLRDETAKDFRGTVEKVAEMGYTGVEFAGYGNIAPSDMASFLKGLNLKTYGTHFGMLPKTDEQLKAEMDMNAALENPYLVCPYMPMETREDALKLADLMNECQKKLRPLGFRLGYHNHAHEFKKVGDEYLMDILLQNTEKDIFAEVDVFWVQYAGADPVSFISKYPNRQPLIHLKELGKDRKSNVEIGSGTVDFAKIFELGPALGIEHYIVEQEEYTLAPIESCRTSLEGLLKYLK